MNFQLKILLICFPLFITAKKHFRGKAISPSFPYKYGGIYWGYNVRLANNLNAVFSESLFKGGYDLIIGTSDKGSSIDSFEMPPFKYVLFIYFFFLISKYNFNCNLHYRIS